MNPMDSQNFQDLLNYFNSKQPQGRSKPRKQLLTKEQEQSYKLRLDRLMKQYNTAIKQRDLQALKLILPDLQQVLRSLNKTIKLVEVKNIFFELAMEQGALDFAVAGFESSRKLLERKTKIYLETTALLAVCHLRKSEIQKAKPYIKEVLQSRNVIKSEATKQMFNEQIINRFDEEIVLAILRSQPRSVANDHSLEKEVDMALQLTDQQIFTMLARISPTELKGHLFEVDSFAKNQLTYKEQKQLPPPEDVIKDENAGKTIFSSLKRVIYNSLCSKDSEVYKMLFTNGLSHLNTKKVIVATIASSIMGLGITATTVIAFVAALIIRFGLDIYCEHYKPMEITSLRRKSK